MSLRLVGSGPWGNILPTEVDKLRKKVEAEINRLDLNTEILGENTANVAEDLVNIVQDIMTHFAEENDKLWQEIKKCQKTIEAQTRTVGYLMEDKIKAEAQRINPVVELEFKRPIAAPKTELRYMQENPFSFANPKWDGSGYVFTTKDGLLLD